MDINYPREALIDRRKQPFEGGFRHDTSCTLALPALGVPLFRLGQPFCPVALRLSTRNGGRDELSPGEEVDEGCQESPGEEAPHSPAAFLHHCTAQRRQKGDYN